MYIKTTVVSIITLSSILVGLSSFIMFTTPLSDNQISAKVFINDGSDSSSSDSNIDGGGSSVGLQQVQSNNALQQVQSNNALQQVQSNNALQQVPSNITDFPSPEDASITQLTFLKTSQDIFGVYHVKGAIKNTGNDTLSFVKVKSHFYDNNMNIVAIESGYTDPISIGPGKTGDFDIILFKDNYGLTPPTFFKLSYEWT
jgi:hypothetical protein